MGKKYLEKLKDPKWQKKRLEILERDNWSCQSCGDNKSTLHVHHKRYLPGKDPWDIPANLLITLCEECHHGERESWQEHMSALEDALKENFLSDHVYSFASGILNIHIEQHPDVTARVVEWALKTPEVMVALQEEYFEYLNSAGK